MLHRIFGWMGGYLKVRLTGKHVERFVNLCRNRGIVLWRLYWEETSGVLYFRIRLKDFYQLRPLSRKCKVRPVAVRRYGLPFMIGDMKKRASFWAGVVCFALLVFFLSTRIWGIEISGESYHTEESILKYLNSIDIYGGMPVKKLVCSDIEEKLRKEYEDIGWASVEKAGSVIRIRVREVALVENEKKETAGSLVSARKGTVVSIVTRKGTAKVKAGDSVKKNQVLISGVLKIYGDNEELVSKKRVHAEGTVVLEWEQNYQDIVNQEYQKKVYTGRERQVHEIRIADQKIFFYNPVKNLQTYEKYDILREGGRLCPFLSLRFPISCYTKRFREIRYEKAVYSEQEAEQILCERYDTFLAQKKKKGWNLQKENLSLKESSETFSLEGSIVFRQEQKMYQKLDTKNKTKHKEKKSNGNNRNNG